MSAVEPVVSAHAAPNTNWRRLAGGADFPEGPTIVEGGAVLWTDAPSGAVMLSSVDGQTDVLATLPARILGTIEITPGTLFVACAEPAGIAILDRAGVFEMTDLRPDGVQLVNDIARGGLVAGRGGEAFFTDSGIEAEGFIGGAWRFLDGVATQVSTALTYANGIVVDVAHDRILIAETSLRRIVTIPYPVGNSPHVPEVFVTMEGGVGPDGVALDGEGAIYVAHYGTGLIHVYEPDGAHRGDIAAPGLNPTNLAIHPDTGDLFLTEAETGALWMLSGVNGAVDSLLTRAGDR